MLIKCCSKGINAVIFRVQYRILHHKDKTVSHHCYLYDGETYTRKTVLYRNGVLFPLSNLVCVQVHAEPMCEESSRPVVSSHRGQVMQTDTLVQSNLHMTSISRHWIRDLVIIIQSVQLNCVTRFSSSIKSKYLTKWHRLGRSYMTRSWQSTYLVLPQWKKHYDIFNKCALEKWQFPRRPDLWTETPNNPVFGNRQHVIFIPIITRDPLHYNCVYVLTTQSAHMRVERQTFGITRGLITNWGHLDSVR